MSDDWGNTAVLNLRTADTTFIFERERRRRNRGRRLGRDVQPRDQGPPDSLHGHQSWYHFLSLYFNITWKTEKIKSYFLMFYSLKSSSSSSKSQRSNIHCIILVSYAHASNELTSCACLENESALAIMAAVLSSSSPSFCPLSSRAMRARASSPTTPDAAPFMPSMPPGPGMCWARLREAFPAANSPTVNTTPRTNKGNDEYLELVPNDPTWCWCRSNNFMLKMETLCNQMWVFPNEQYNNNNNNNCGRFSGGFY